MDIVNKILKWIDHYRYTALSLVIIVIMAVGVITTIGCVSKTTGLDGNKVDRLTFTSQVEAQVAVLEAKATAGFANLDQQDLIKARLFEVTNQLVTKAASGETNPIGYILLALTGAGTVLGVGSSLDNGRKDKVITSLKPKT